MKQQLTILFAFFATLSYSQDILWEKSLGGKHADYLMDVIATPDYGFILAGSSLSDKTGNKSQAGKGGYDFLIWKMDENGELEWEKSFGGSGNDFLHSIKPSYDAGLILAGTTSSTKEEYKTDQYIGLSDIWVIKLDATGNVIWQKKLGGYADEQLATVIETKDHGILICGSSESDDCTSKFSGNRSNIYCKNENSRGGQDYWLIKLNSKGDFEWQKTIGGNYFDQLRSVVQTNDGGFFIAGVSNSNIGYEKEKENLGQTDIWYMKIDSKGEILWQDMYGSNGDENVYTVIQTIDNKLLIAGNTNSIQTPYGNSTDGSDFFLLQLQSDGSFISEKTYSVTKEDILTNLIQNKDGTLLLCGYGRSSVNEKEEGTEDYLIIKIDLNGNVIWQKQYGSNGKDVLSKAIETRDGGYLLAGTASPIFPSTGGVLSSNKTRRGGNLGGIQQTQNQQLQSATSEVNQAIDNVQNDINKGVNDKMYSTTNKINDALGSDKDSSLKYGLNSPTGGVKLPSLGEGTNGASALDGLANAMNEKQGKKGTGDQKKVFGSNDFWVVKLRDKDKKEVVKVTIEALPNPATTFTNVIVGYEYESGTATLVDIAGHILYQTSITSRTVPIDLSPYPEGIYIVNIKTNVSSDGVKVIKKGSRN